MRFGFGRIAHPVEPVDAIAVSGANGLDQIRVAFLRRLWKVFLHEDTAEDHSHGAVLRVENALPARPRLFLAGKYLMIKIEIFAIDFLAQIWCVFAEEMKTEIVA